MSFPRLRNSKLLRLQLPFFSYLAFQGSTATAFRAAFARPPPSSAVQMSTSQGKDGLMFGRFFIPEDHIFYRSPSGLSAAFVNLRPIVPGHVLVVPQRVVDREKELDEEESLDLWKTVREVGHRVEEEYKASALNIAVQDGKAAGQSVPHVHFHILPRAVGDFERNDDVYDKIEEFDARPTKLHVPEDSERKDRTFEEMKEEAGRLRRLFAVNT